MVCKCCHEEIKDYQKWNTFTWRHDKCQDEVARRNAKNKCIYCGEKGNRDNENNYCGNCTFGEYTNYKGPD